MVTDVVEEAAQQCARQCGIPDASTDYRDILKRRDIQAVAICSSTDTHVKIIAEAAVVARLGTEEWEK